MAVRAPFTISIDASKVPPYMLLKNAVVSRAVDAAVLKSGLYVQGQVKDSIAGRSKERPSVDTGRFLNSVQPRFGKGYAEVGTRVFYAPFLEYGTSRMKARNHFRNSRARSVAKINDYFRSAVKSASDK